MYLKEIWRYPVKSMAGERLQKTSIGPLGIPRDRTILVVRRGRVVTARTHHQLLGLKATISNEGRTQISGHDWDSAEALSLVKAAAGSDAELVPYEGLERFDVLPLLIATDGAIAEMGFDGRRLRANLIVGGVPGQEERHWPHRSLRIGDAIAFAAQLRGRCVMTTYDPDTLLQDREVLRRIARDLDGQMALDCSVVKEGEVAEGMPVSLLEEEP